MEKDVQCDTPVILFSVEPFEFECGGGFCRMMRSIERLPETTHSSVRSGVVICDLTRIVEELVFNSLDAGATEVMFSLLKESWCCY